MTQTDSPDKEPDLAQAVADFIMTLGHEWRLFQLLDWLTNILRRFGYA